jgi:hypothetical protein
LFSQIALLQILRLAELAGITGQSPLPFSRYRFPGVLIFRHDLSVKKMYRSLRVLGKSAVMGNHANGCSTLMQLGEKLHDCVAVLTV